MTLQGICALCLQARALQNSHIISEFLYTSMYDAMHRFHQMSVDEEGSKLWQKGLREYLLCEECEAKLSVWERYARDVLRGGVPLNYKQEGGITWVNGIDYTRFKLFQLSILWRAGAATGPFFSQVTLGSHQERIRRMLLEENPGKPTNYGCAVRGVRLQGRKADVVIQPTKIRVGNVRGFRFVFGGFLWVYACASHNLIGPLSQAVLQRNGRLALTVGDLEDAGFFRDLIARL